MPPITLTQQERDKFAAWLEWDADIDKQLTQTMETLPGLEAMIQHRRAEEAAKRIVARLLRSTEEQTI